jgi:TonB family protein
MRAYRLIAILIAVFGFSVFVQAKKDPIEAFKHAVERCTLNQRGTKAFHLRAIARSTSVTSWASLRSGTVEIWWVSPTEWRQEVRTSGFHQITIVNYGVEWQKTEGSYYPEWLRETATALIEPIPHLDQVLDRLRDSEITFQDGMIQFSWTRKSTDGTVESELGEGVGINERTGLVAYGGGLGWDGEFLEYENYHGRQIARVLHVGNPEVTAVVEKLEPLQQSPPSFFDVEQKGGDAQLLRTVIVDEMLLRKNLQPSKPPEWPPLIEGPLEGTVTAQIAVDREGKVREVTSVAATNAGLKETARQAIEKLRFTPYLQDGVPVQVVARITLPFKTTRATAPPAGTQRLTSGGVQKFTSVGSYFDFTRRICFPAAGTATRYILRAKFQMKTAAGKVEEGEYVDTWINVKQWRREATIGGSRYIRTQSGEQRYKLAEGPDADILRLVLTLMEPIPALDTLNESAWHIKRDTLLGFPTIRFLAGTEHPDGTPDNAVALWFDASGRLLRTYFEGIDAQRSQFEVFSGAQVAHHIKVLYQDKLATSIQVTDILSADEPLPSIFELPGHEYVRKASTEVR